MGTAMQAKQVLSSSTEAYADAIPQVSREGPGCCSVRTPLIMIKARPKRANTDVWCRAHAQYARFAHSEKSR
jgi:hypothetical protein